jgi:hypothetical protein
LAATAATPSRRPRWRLDDQVDAACRSCPHRPRHVLATVVDRPSAPSSRARASFSGFDEVTITRAPIRRAIASAASATPPPMPWISTVSLGCSRPRLVSIRHAVRNVSGNAAASAHDWCAGRRPRLTAGTFTNSANVPGTC